MSASQVCSVKDAKVSTSELPALLGGNPLCSEIGWVLANEREEGGLYAEA
jgi:hypothetical protein